MSKELERNTAFSSMAGLCTTLGAFACSIIVARVLGVEGAGVVAYAVWAVTLLVTLADGGVPATLTRFLPELTGRGNASEAKRLAHSLFRPLAVGVFAALAIGFTMAAISDGATEPQDSRTLSTSAMWAVIGVYAAAQILANYTLAYAKGNQNFARVALLNLVSMILQLLAVAAGAFFFGTAGALAGYVAGTLIPAVLALYLVAGDATVESETKARVRRYSIYTWMAAIASAFVWSRIEIYFLERSWGTNSVGLFTVGMTMSSLAIQGPMLMTGALLPHFSSRFGQNAIDSLRQSYRTGTRLMAFLVMPACFGMAAITPVLLPALYGADFAPAVDPATVLAIAAAFGATAVIGTNMVFAMERSDFVLYSSLIGAGLAIATGMLLVPVYGLMGAAVARAIIQITMVFVGMWFIAKHLKCWPPFNDLFRIFIAAAISALAARAAVITIDGPAVMVLTIAITTGAAVYFALVRFTNVLPDSDLAIILSFVRRAQKWMTVRMQRNTSDNSKVKETYTAVATASTAEVTSETGYGNVVAAALSDAELTQPRRTIVLGAGVAGLTAARLLSDEPNQDIRILDTMPDPGGSHRSENFGPYTFDIGTIVFWPKNAFFQLFPSLEKRCSKVVFSQSRITPGGLIRAYPMSAKEIFDRGPAYCVRIGCEILRNRFAFKKIASAEDFAIYYMGKTLYGESGLRNYLSRFYGIEPANLDPVFALRRMGWIARFGSASYWAGRLCTGLLTRLRQAPAEDLPHAMVRPQKGFAPLYKMAVNELSTRNVKTQLAIELVAIEKISDGFRIRTSDGAVLDCHRLINTMPIETLARLLPAPLTDCPISKPLTTLFISFQGARNFTAPVMFNFHRGGEWKRLTMHSDYYGLEDGRDYLCVEINGDFSGAIAANGAFEKFCEHVQELGLFRGDLDLVGHTVSQFAYPIYTPDNMRRRTKALNTLTALGIESVGRQGAFDYLPTSGMVTTSVTQALNGMTPDFASA